MIENAVVACIGLVAAWWALRAVKDWRDPDPAARHRALFENLPFLLLVGMYPVAKVVGTKSEEAVVGGLLVMLVAVVLWIAGRFVGPERFRRGS